MAEKRKVAIMNISTAELLLQILSNLLHDLKTGHHRVLIFTQMSKMLNILEAFLNYHGHTYLRLDGSTKIEQRQVLMERCV